MSFRLSAILVLGLFNVLVCVKSQFYESPCPDVFGYRSDESGVYGVIHLRSNGPGPVSTVELKVNYTVATRLSPNYVGRLQPIGNSLHALQDYNAGVPLDYRVDFPVTSPLPRVTTISVNGDILCYGQGDRPGPTQFVTTASLQHTLFLKGQSSPGYHNQFETRPTQSKPNSVFELIESLPNDGQVYMIGEDGDRFGSWNSGSFPSTQQQFERPPMRPHFEPPPRHIFESPPRPPFEPPPRPQFEPPPRPPFEPPPIPQFEPPPGPPHEPPPRPLFEPLPRPPPRPPHEPPPRPPHEPPPRPPHEPPPRPPHEPPPRPPHEPPPRPQFEPPPRPPHGPPPRPPHEPPPRPPHEPPPRPPHEPPPRPPHEPPPRPPHEPPPRPPHEPPPRPPHEPAPRPPREPPPRPPHEPPPRPPHEPPPRPPREPPPRPPREPPPRPPHEPPPRPPHEPPPRPPREPPPRPPHEPPPRPQFEQPAQRSFPSTQYQFERPPMRPHFEPPPRPPFEPQSRPPFEPPPRPPRDPPPRHQFEPPAQRSFPSTQHQFERPPMRPHFEPPPRPQYEPQPRPQFEPPPRPPHEPPPRHQFEQPAQKPHHRPEIQYYPVEPNMPPPGRPPRPPPPSPSPEPSAQATSPPSSAEVQCGVVSGGNERIPLIYNGQGYSRGDWPWLVAIYKRKDGSLTFICSGTLVSNRHVVTAAHCMQQKNTYSSKKDIVVKVGVYNLEDWGDDITVTRTLSSSTIHQSYNATSLANDILVMTFERSVEFNTNIRPACLWSGNPDQSRIIGASGVVAGWGQSESEPAGRGEPRVVRVPVVSTSVCRASRPEFHKLTSSNTLCAGDRNGAGPCLGDSGGGLYLLEGGRWQLRGVVSLSLRADSGDSTCNLNEYIVFTDSAKYYNWIKSVMQY